MLLPTIKMQKPFQLVYRTYLMSHRTCIFPFLKGQRCLLNTKHKMVSLALTSQHQCLHTSAAVCVSEEREFLGKASSQPVDHRNKELEGENLTTSSGNLAQRDSIEPNSVEIDPLQDKSISLVQRFKRTFKQYGKVLIPVHLLTSSIWFGAFYYAALKGINVVPFLEFIGLPESIVNILKQSQSGNALTAYAMYKIATPARYTVTLGGTSITVKYLRKHGYMSTPPPVKGYIQDRMEETKERLSGKMEETRDMISGKMEETKEKLTGKMEETKDRITEKIQETKEKVSFIKKKE
ncbi:protein FAM210A [Rhineura floridana]|uniref:protein FAM210A n=1 Tax=Rhineura floridana TaxID=261503 RepID=UPI002AC812FA|nr:protein FAM210A [Rhineura floridana]XP_061450775.1 protein FAM210A [Rhineura floridana]XP_061450783.1 protein FAM210A [Rhineura floridana]XP_061450793.1 protein FAM210A [Rhineura floridana]XP_061450801.1 protein FAM210A [Rhineura floridana]